MRQIHHGDCLDVLPTLPKGAFALAYIDPPFNTGKRQKRSRLKVTRALENDAQDAKTRTGFGGQQYLEEVLESPDYGDTYVDYIPFLLSRIEAALPLLKPNASLFVHVDFRESHYVKVALDKLIGRDHFMNEIIWAYDYGGRSKKKWPAKHDTIFWYTRDPKNYVFNFEDMERIPYMAPGLVGKEKAARGKTPTDVWWHTIVATNGKEKTGYPTQKPVGILKRIIEVHTNPGDDVLDFFAGSGSTGAAAEQLGRGYTLIDQSADAVAVMKKRLGASS